MRLRIIALIVALVSVLSVGAQNYGYNSGTSRYYNSRFGFYFTYPSFMSLHSGAANSDGGVLYSADHRILIEVWAMLDSSSYTTNSLLQSMKNDVIAEGSRITYSYAKNGTVVLSGYTCQNKIFYEKCVRCKLYSPVYGYVDVLAIASVEYYQNDKYRGEEVIKHFSGFPYE